MKKKEIKEREKEMTYLHANVVFVRLLVGNKWLDYEMVQYTSHVLDRCVPAHAGFDPLDAFLPSLVDGKKTGLASALDQLIRLHNQLGLKQPRIGQLKCSLVEIL